ncbi:hypothetical protein ACFOD9_06215 [Novosphingobium bradum]|uniref:Chorismate lyase n=1 Tax=Novosphingobium bradum TaxID=1737444 RepID=A0ABV7IPF7_9SPHN
MSRAALPAGAFAMLALATPPLVGCAPVPPAPARSSSRSPAPEADAALAEFEVVLAANPSATAALEQWCARRGIAPEAEVRATMITAGADRDEAAALASAARLALGLGADEPLGFRHVRLDCGGVVLSEAYNWYAPARLTPDMTRALATSRIPFGKVAAPLRYRRELIESRRGSAGECPPGVILSHRALLRLPDGHPLSLLVECYTGANLGG